MSYVIAEPCVATCSTACVDVCPVDCIHGPLEAAAIARIPQAERAARTVSVQLYIDPDACTSCGACEAVCPAHAIFDEDDLPEVWSHYREINARFFESA
jgi:NAD-dependent dihydropyrimidine dehydrogenase PreA subunit